MRQLLWTLFSVWIFLNVGYGIVSVVQTNNLRKEYSEYAARMYLAKQMDADKRADRIQSILSTGTFNTRTSAEQWQYDSDVTASIAGRIVSLIMSEEVFPEDMPTSLKDRFDLTREISKYLQSVNVIAEIACISEAFNISELSLRSIYKDEVVDHNRVVRQNITILEDMDIDLPEPYPFHFQPDMRNLAAK